MKRTTKEGGVHMRIPDSLFNEVKNLPIVDIISSRVPLRKKGTSFVGECPWHSDTSQDSLSVSESRGKWRCFVCGCGGDCADFVQRFEGISLRAATLELAYEYGKITEAEYNELQGEKPKKKGPIKKAPPKKEQRLAPIADLATRDLFYKALLEAFGLTDEDKLYLKGRGVTRSYVHMFCSLPEDKNKDGYARILQKVEKKLGKPIESFKGVPGLYFDDEKNKWKLFVPGEGIGIAIVNNEGFIEAIHVRLKEIKEKGKRYSWISSSFADGCGKHLHQIFGASSGTPISVIKPKCEIKKIAITEGEFKAIILSRGGYLAISVQGISTYEKALPVIKESFSSDTKEVLICFDSDFIGNKAVKDTVISVGEALEGMGIPSKVAVWDGVFGKGIDDLILSENGAGHLLRYDFTRFREIENSISKMKMADLKELVIGEREDFPKLKSEIEKWRAAALKSELIGISI